MSLPHRESARAFLVTLAVALTGCGMLGRYELTLNQVVLHQPSSMLSVETIVDPHLAVCLQQSLIDQNVTRKEDLRNLNCSDAGIVSLEGLEEFSQIQSLKLSGNRIRNLLVLERLSSLEQLWLDGNIVIDPIPMLKKASLKRLELAGNRRLQCPRATYIPAALSLTLPAHCNQK